MMRNRLTRYINEITSAKSWRHNAEIASVLFLSIATILTAWSAYQATRWSAIQSKAYQEVSIARIDASREFTMAAQNFALDSIVFTKWVEATSTGNEELASSLRGYVMTDAFIPVFDAWVAGDPFDPAGELRNPMANTGYRDRLLASTLRLETRAESRFDDAIVAYDKIDRYVLVTVICAVVLFFAGIAPKFESANLQLFLLSGALVMLVAATGTLIRLSA